MDPLQRRDDEEALRLHAIAGSVMIGAMLHLTSHLQIVLAFTPLQAGLTVATRNTRDMEGVGVNLVDPWL